MKKDKKAIPDLAYNTQQEYLIMPEYGRNVQQLVRHAQKLEETAYRQQFCEEIVDLIQQLYPQSKSVEDYREKLWKHLFQIAKYDLDATTPSGIVPSPEDEKNAPTVCLIHFRIHDSSIMATISKGLFGEPLIWRMVQLKRALCKP